jgi:hypothetical protein
MQYDSNDVHSSGDSQRPAEDDPTIEQRPWGFFTFVVSAVTLLLIAGRQPADQTQAKSNATLAPVIALAAAAPGNSNDRPQTLGVESESAVPPTMESDERLPPAEATVARKAARGNSEVISFETKSIVTTEKAVAAVFVLTRSKPMSGLTRVRWESRSGTADAAVDFSDASGTAVVAEGQRQAALYVPLRNDLLQEADETFKVCLHSAQHARLAAVRCAEATIRDDD